MAEEPKPTDDVNRRQFFLKLGLGSLSIAAAGTAAFAYQYLEPNVLFEPSPVVNAGKPDRYPPDSVTLDVNTGIFIIHSEEGYFSLSAVCTHLGCLTAWKPELGIIACPCHGSKFYVQQQGNTNQATKSRVPRPSRCRGSACGSMTTETCWSIVPPTSRLCAFVRV